MFDDGLNNLRALLSVLVFALGIYLLIDLFVQGLSVLIIGASIVCFVLAHFLWPSKNDNQGKLVFDLIECIIDFPYRAVLFVFRTFTSILRFD